MVFKVRVLGLVEGEILGIRQANLQKLSLLLIGLLLQDFGFPSLRKRVNFSMLGGDGGCDGMSKFKIWTLDKRGGGVVRQF